MKKLTVDGITFETTKEAKAAERELEAIEKIRGRMDVTDPTYAKVLYEKLIEKEMLHTKVGDKFLAELQGYFDAEEAQNAPEAAAAEEDAETAGASTEQEGDTVIPYLDGSVPAEPAGAAGAAYPQAEAVAAAGEEDIAPEEVSWEKMSAAEVPSQGAESAADTRTAAQSSDETGALNSILFGKDFSVMPEEGTEEPVDAELDAFMQEYGLFDEEEAAEASSEKSSEEEDEELSPEELEAFMNGYDVAEAPAPETGETEAQPEEESEETDAAGLDALVNEYSEDTSAAAEEAPLQLHIDEKEDFTGREEAGFELNLDETTLVEAIPEEVDLTGEEPDDDTLLAQARELKKELHQEDLSEVFSEREESPEKKHFSLYGVLLVSIILNVILVFSMVIMVQVFKNSDNRNILNYERILEQEYQTATPTDADVSDLQ